MAPDYHTMATDLLNSGMGDEGRLKFILECIKKEKPLYRTDMKFLESMTEKLDQKIRMLQGEKAKPKSLVTDEFIDGMISRKGAKNASPRKKSFFVRLFSR